MSARERILDAATTVMRSRGYAAATTREIARAADCSEALLYKNFTDKHEIFAAVLGERMPELSGVEDVVGASTVRDNLVRLVAQLLGFYVASLPIAASILGTPSLRDAERDASSRRGGGADVPAVWIQGYLEAEVAAGRIPRAVDVRAVARAITGAALFEAFQAVFAGDDAVPDALAVANRIVAATRWDTQPSR